MATLFAEDTGELLTFDGIIEESWVQSASITDHPVEDFGFVADHRQRMPDTLTVTAIVTAQPIVDENSNLVGGNARLRKAKKFFDNNADRSLFSYISVRLGTVDNIMLESVTFDIDNQDRIEFVLEFKEIIYGRTEIVDLPPIRKRRQEPETDESEQPGKEADDDIKIRTVLSRWRGEDIKGDIQSSGNFRGFVEGLFEGIR